MSVEPLSSPAAPAPALASSVTRGSMASIFAQVGRYGIQLAASVTLARLIAPADYGLAALATALTAFLGLFTDLGLSVATVQRADLTARQLSTMFWLNAAIGLLLSMLVYSMAPAAAYFFGAPALTQAIHAMAPLFLLGSLRVQHSAMLARKLSFGRIASAEIGATLIGASCGIWAALHGWGVYALIAQSLAGTLAETIAIWALGWWLPGAPGPLAEIRPLLHMGGNLTAFNFVNYIARTADNLLLGKFCGVLDLGLYSRAYGLMMMPNTMLTAPLQRVMVPALSQLQHDRERFERAYFRAMRMLAAVVFPMGLGMAVLAEEIVHLMLGPQWAEAAPLLRVLAAITVIQPLLSSTGWVYLARGRTDKLFHWALLNTPMVLTGYLAGLPWGAGGIAISYALVSALLTLPLGIAYAFRVLDLPVLRFWRLLAAPALSALLMAGIVLYVRMAWPGMGSLRTSALILLGAAVHLVCMRIIAAEMVADALQLVRRRRPEIVRKGG